ncbi:MAG: hypothetical protein AAGL98_09065, partial [Planctomycetota bacterium]
MIPKPIVGPFHNQLVMGTIAALLLVALLVGLAKRLSGEKKTNRDYVVQGTGWQLLETVCVFIRENVARPNLGKLTDKY